ncbi:1-acyl-sn-glycerol-3-phosphate acyltransferase [Chryseolinea sp. T2]|uniref:1-acyl-sn-glycerol-3-phosphate acyltransferase n=1 Tax=Chryseolinea sp. T2 TaxID=3129255 RepID=UPI0030777089
MSDTLFFRGMKIWCTAALNFYFKQWQINNAKAVEVKGPIIFVPTHQNAFLDAVLVICSQRRNPWSIARASVFKKGFVTTLLTAVKIKPVFRMRDGFSTLKNNDAIIQEWLDMLAGGEDIIIFAEGNHNDPYARGELQKGFARMALKFQHQYENIPLNIIPVGVHYEDHHSFRSRVLVNFGDPIDVNSIDHSNLNEREKLERIVEITEQALVSLSVQIGADEYEEKYRFLKKNREYHTDMLAQIKSDQRIVNEFPGGAKPTVKSGVPRWLKLLNPLVWLGWLLNLLPYSFIKRFIRKKVKDPQFIGSLKYALGMFLVPVYYLIILIVCYAITGSLPATLLAALILPVSGIIAADSLKR